MTADDARLLLAQCEFDEAAREWAAADVLASQGFLRQAVTRAYFSVCSMIAPLSLTERIQLVEDLWDSIAAEPSASHALTDAQTAELHRRLQAHRDDPTDALPLERVRAELLGSRNG